ncbi:MAG TPA: glycosyltransferase family 2 protein [Pyrinomonadaceae bacterium]|nr:glycosyltransferase family 2 protein [Pyrinomonadaceae bacterium]
MWVFYLFAALLIIQAIISLRGGARYLSYIRRETARDKQDFTPYSSIIAPCRGLDQGLHENLAALFRQDYPTYEILFVTDSMNDPALAVIEELRREFEATGHVATRIIFAGEAKHSGQKVHNLRVAVSETNPKSEVFVFVDSDARPNKDWLRNLIEPLYDEEVGAATGYRWFIPVRGGFASRLRSVWNASISSALGERVRRNFCWGGSTAIHRETFERARVLEAWSGAASDDFAMTRALNRAHLPIHFVPCCLTVSHEDCNWRELLEFTTRQLKITRVYAPHLWQIVLFSNLLFVPVFFGGILLTITRAALGLSFIAPLAFILAIYILGILKAHLRFRAVQIPLAQYSAELRRDAFAHLFLWPLASAIYLYNALAALLSRKINWRGITYELKSPTETEILKSRSQESGVRESE